ncbi:MAG TPA: ABC transporter ATP-binding protein [Candidatus Saccharimonadales bacterium]
MSASIQTNDLTKIYPGAKTPSLDKLSISVESGEVYGFLGANGAGKSTTIRVLLNFLQPTSGQATILGKDSVKDSVTLKKHMGYLAGDVAFYNNVTGAQLLDYLNRLHGVKDKTYTNLLTKRFEVELTKPIGKLSKGNRQKIGIVQAFMHQPDVLVLDEPTSGLDPLMQERFYETVLEAKKRGAAIFLSSHSFAEVQRTCDRVGIIRHGKLVREGSLADMAEAQMPTLLLTFKQAVPAGLAKQKALEVIDTKGRSATVRATKSNADLFAALSKYDIIDFQTQELELEGEFMSYYQEDEQ